MPLKRRTLLLITGASRGLGRETAVQLSAALGGDSVVVLVARSAVDLADTALSVAAAAPHVTVVQQTCDLSAADDADLHALVSAGLSEAGEAPLDAAICVHNAGTVGDVSRSTLQQESVSDIDRYFHMNVSSCLALNAVFVRLLRPRVSGGDADITLINVSSLCALKPFRSMSLYCSGKAARDMAFGVLAAEAPELRVLSYAPGPLVTAMAREIAEGSGDAEIRQSFSNGMKKGFLECSVTVKRLLGILEANTFKSGSHVDYYDQD